MLSDDAIAQIIALGAYYIQFKTFTYLHTPHTLNHAALCYLSCTMLLHSRCSMHHAALWSLPCASHTTHPLLHAPTMHTVLLHTIKCTLHCCATMHPTIVHCSYYQSSSSLRTLLCTFSPSHTHGCTCCCVPPYTKKPQLHRNP